MKFEIEDYYGNTICSFTVNNGKFSKMEDCDLADEDPEGTFRVQLTEEPESIEGSDKAISPENMKLAKEAKKDGVEFDMETVKEHGNHELEIMDYRDEEDEVDAIVFECQDCDEIIGVKDFKNK